MTVHAKTKIKNTRNHIDITNSQVCKVLKFDEYVLHNSKLLIVKKNPLLKNVKDISDKIVKYA